MQTTHFQRIIPIFRIFRPTNVRIHVRWSIIGQINNNKVQKTKLNNNGKELTFKDEFWKLIANISETELDDILYTYMYIHTYCKGPKFIQDNIKTKIHCTKPRETPKRTARNAPIQAMELEPYGFNSTDETFHQQLNALKKAIVCKKLKWQCLSGPLAKCSSQFNYFLVS